MTKTPVYQTFLACQQWKLHALFLEGCGLLESARDYSGCPNISAKIAGWQEDVAAAEKKAADEKQQVPDDNEIQARCGRELEDE